MKKKILCMCQKGNSRSVACAYWLKKKYGMDAIACGFKTQGMDTLEMLVDWADCVILMAPQYYDRFPDKWKEKTIILNVGHDTYFKGHDQNLLDQCERFIKLNKICES